MNLQPRPLAGICVATPDGAYFDRQDRCGDQDDGKVQIIVVGRMNFAPIEYENAINDHFNDRRWEIESIEFMTNIKEEMNRLTRARGFVSIIFKAS